MSKKKASDQDRSKKKRKADKKKDKKKNGVKGAPISELASDGTSDRPKLTEEDALALAQAIVEMVNEGAEHPVAFFVSGSDALGRELIQLQGGETEDLKTMVPVVLDAAQVRRFAMLTIADELLWQSGQSGQSGQSDREGP